MGSAKHGRISPFSIWLRTPDARVGDVAFDVTLTKKTSKTSQIQGFLGADFQPRNIIIVRPSQLGSGSTYAIQGPEAGK